MYKLFNKLKSIFCKPRVEEIKTIFLYDVYFDYMTDNDDLEDVPTIVKITYSKTSGKILDREMIVPHWGENIAIASDEEYNEFCKVCKIKSKKDYSSYGK